MRRAKISEELNIGAHSEEGSQHQSGNAGMPEESASGNSRPTKGKRSGSVDLSLSLPISPNLPVWLALVATPDLRRASYAAGPLRVGLAKDLQR